MSTALDIISGAMRLFGALGQSENPTDAEAADGLSALNELLDEFSANSLLIYTIQRRLFNFVSGQQVYTAGTGGNFDTSYPQKLERAGIVLNNQPVSPLEIPIDIYDYNQWADVSLKSLTGAAAWPTIVYADGSFPLNNLSFWPVPNDATIQFAMYAWQPLTQFADLTTDFSFPPGYLKAVRYNLAASWAPEFGIEASPTVQRIAQESKYQLQVNNTLPIRLNAGGMGFQSALGRFYSDNNAGRG